MGGGIRLSYQQPNDRCGGQGMAIDSADRGRNDISHLIPSMPTWMRSTATLLASAALVGCGGDSSSASPTPPVTSGPPSVSLSASTATAFVGQPVTLTWVSSNATSCTATGGWSGSLATSGTQRVTPTAAGAATYSISCSGSGGSASASSTVTATTPAVSFTNSFSPNSLTISTSEGAPYDDGDLWTRQPFVSTRTVFGYGPTRIIRLYICLNGRVFYDQCSQAPTPTGPVPDDMLAEIDAGIAAFARTGDRLLVRFIYNFSTGASAKDVPIDLIVKHIDQLAPILLKNRDLIFALEAGFIGQGGEWHQSTNGNDTPAAHKIVLDKELSYFNGVFPIVVAFPGQLITYTGNTTPPAAFGIHDDAFGANDNDGFRFTPAPPINAAFTPCTQPNNFLGYCLPSYTQSQFMAFTAQLSTTTMLVAEPDAVLSPATQNCAAIDAHAYQFHPQAHVIYIDNFPTGYGDLLQSGGCATTFLNKIGTRIELQQASVIGNTTPGGSLFVSLTMVNAGYGRVVRARPATLVFTSGSSVVAQVPIDLSSLDLRQLASASPAAPKTFQFTLAAPTSLPAGKTISVALLIPDPAPSLTSQAAYALPLNSLDASGRAVFDAATGYNTIGSFIAGAAVQATNGAAHPLIARAQRRPGAPK